MSAHALAFSPSERNSYFYTSILAVSALRRTPQPVDEEHASTWVAQPQTSILAHSFGVSLWTTLEEYDLQTLIDQSGHDERGPNATADARHNLILKPLPLPACVFFTINLKALDDWMVENPFDMYTKNGAWSWSYQVQFVGSHAELAEVILLGQSKTGTAYKPLHGKWLILR